MNKYQAIGILALLILVTALPLYALLEPSRMDKAQAELRDEFMVAGADMYVDNCAACHGATGEGIGAMPALNIPGLAEADRAVLYDTIGHAPHGTAMSAWHLDEGGGLNSYQVESLVTLITSADWIQVGELATAKGFAAPAPAAPEVELATMDSTGEDPHECQACHEEPDMHAERFGLNCSRCHTLDAWKPALLTRHIFYLDHGDEGKIACQTCHTESYSANTCYECHDHDPVEMETAHLEEELDDWENCAQCHPTGIAGEAASLGYGRSGRANIGERQEPSGQPVLGDEIPALGEDDTTQDQDEQVGMQSSD